MTSTDPCSLPCDRRICPLWLWELFYSIGSDKNGDVLVLSLDYGRPWVSLLSLRINSSIVMTTNRQRMRDSHGREPSCLSEGHPSRTGANTQTWEEGQAKISRTTQLPANHRHARALPIPENRPSWPMVSWAIILVSVRCVKLLSFWLVYYAPRSNWFPSLCHLLMKAS